MARRRLFRTGSSPRLLKSLRELERLSWKMESLVKQDAEAFQMLVKAHRMNQGVVGARRRAIGTPLEICRATVLAAKVFRTLTPLTGPYLGSDLKAGRALLQGAFEGAYVTGMMNFQKRERDPQARAMRRELTLLRRKMQKA